MALRRDNKVVAEEWERVKELFETALDCPAQQRAELLSRLQQDDAAVARQVSDLLTSHEQAGDFLHQPLIFSADFLDDLEEPQRFAPDDVLCSRFKIVRLIGKGGMGEVYEAFDQELEEHVALKTLRFEVSSNEIFTARFRREIQLARKVTHPNVCRIFESLRHQAGNETISVLSMELLQGQTLADYLKSKGRLSPDEALPLAQQIIDGLSAVHAAGIIHRDLKPSNLVLVPEGDSFKVKITDFGIAGGLPANPSQPALTQASKILGTPDYMAPEQLEHGRATIQSDIYSLGLVLYEMVTGAKPFAGGGAWKRLYEDPRPPKKLAPDLPDQWNKTIICCLEKDPRYRFSSANSIAENLTGNALRASIPTKPFFVRLKAIAQKGIGTILAFIVVSIVIVTVLYFNQSPQLPPGTTVLVTNIATADPALAGITVALKGELAQSAHFEIEEDSKIVEILKQMNRKPDALLDAKTARQVAWRSGAPLVISGSLAPVGNGYVLSMRIERIIGPLFPTLSWENDFQAKDKIDLLNTVRNASSWARKFAGETAKDRERLDRPVEDTTTSSWLALQRYTEAEEKYSAGDTDNAVFMLREAIQADPGFAKAHMRLADILVSKKQYAKGYSEWKTAFRLASGQQLTSREYLRILGQGYEDTGDFAQAEEQFQAYQVHYPNDYQAWFYWGSALSTMDRKPAALTAFTRAVQLRSDSPAPHEHLAELYLLLARFDDADREIKTLRSLGVAEWPTWLEGVSAFLQGHYESGIEKMSELGASGSEEWQSRHFSEFAKFLAELGRLPEAVRSLEDGIAFDHDKSRVAAEADKDLALAYLLYRQHNFQRAAQLLSAALALDSSPDRLTEAGTLFARIGVLQEARRIEGLLDQQPKIKRTEFAKFRLQGEIALAEGKTNNAINDFLKAKEIARPREQHDYFARALERTGQSAVRSEAYKSLSDNPARIWLHQDSPDFGLWSRSTLRYLAATNDVAQPSCLIFNKLRQMWSGADPEQLHSVDNLQPKFKVCTSISQ